MDKKAEILIRHLIFGAIIVTMLTLGATSMITETTSKNLHMAGEEVDNFKAVFDKTEELNESIEDMEGGLKNSSIENIPAVGPTASLIQSTWGYIKGTVTSISLVKDMFVNSDSASSLPIPPWVGLLISLMIAFFIGFVIISLVFKGKI